MENSLQALFDEICPKTMYCLWPDFGATLKIHKKSKFDRNDLKIEIQHKNMCMYQEKL